VANGLPRQSGGSCVTKDSVSANEMSHPVCTGGNVTKVVGTTSCEGFLVSKDNIYGAAGLQYHSLMCL